jgi:hypothetical protein
MKTKDIRDIVKATFPDDKVTVKGGVIKVRAGSPRHVTNKGNRLQQLLDSINLESNVREEDLGEKRHGVTYSCWYCIAEYDTAS